MPREARSFRYQPRSREDVKERANARGGNFDSIFKSKFKLYKMRDGKNILRIMPPTWDNPKHYGYDIWVNYNIGADNQSYLSISKMKGEKDPLDEARKQADRDGDKDLAKALRPTQRILMWVIDRQDEDEGPQLFNCPFTLDKAIANLSFDEDTKEVVFIDDPEKGNDIRFYKEGSGIKTDYDASKMKILNSSPLCDDEGLQEDWLKFITDNPLPEVLQFYDYDHINNVFDGNVGSRDDDVEEKPRRRARDDDDDTPPPRRRAEPEDDDRPAPRRRAQADEDDEPAPRQRSRGGEDSDERPSIRDRLRDRKRPDPDEEPED